MAASMFLGLPYRSPNLNLCPGNCCRNLGSRLGLTIYGEFDRTIVSTVFNFYLIVGAPEIPVDDRLF
jgi:hypothetical protein